MKVYRRRVSNLRRRHRWGRIVNMNGTNNPPWFHLDDAPINDISARYAEQLAVYEQFMNQHLRHRLGQALEIAIFRALSQYYPGPFFGRYPDLENPTQNGRFRKEEPLTYLGANTIVEGGALDFMVQDQSGEWAGIEAKNIR
jgi:hypothetical protein